MVITYYGDSFTLRELLLLFLFAYVVLLSYTAMCSQYLMFLTAGNDVVEFHS